MNCNWEWGKSWLALENGKKPGTCPIYVHAVGENITHSEITGKYINPWFSFMYSMSEEGEATLNMEATINRS